MRDLVVQMLTIIDRRSWSAEGCDQRVGITIGSVTIDVDPADPLVGLAFERLASAIEATIAAERARRMIEAAGIAAQPLPLWLVTGSHVLAEWLTWAGAGNALRKVLTFTDAVGMAPVAGCLDRHNGWELGQGGAKIRVRGGMATAERVELSDTPGCTAMLGQTARIRIEAHALPDTLIAGLQRDERANARRSLAEVVSHTVFTAADLQIAGMANEGADVAFEVESRWTPLEPIPAAARAVLPADADPISPWRVTASERQRLDGLVEEARHRAAAIADLH